MIGHHNRLMAAATAALLLVAAATATAAAVAGEPSFVIPVDHQVASSQPYARGANSKQVTMTVGGGLPAGGGGSPSSPVTYSFTIDTGSGIPMITCKTPYSDINCKPPLSASSNYVLDAAHTISTAAACDATGIGCLLSDNQCFVSEPLTGGSDFNINNGVFATDTLSFVGAIASPKLSLTATVACASAYIKCNYDNTSTPCYTQSTECPTTPGAANFGQASKVQQGACPGSNKGIEAGWTFNAGTAASKIGVPEQVYQAGLIKRRVMGFCYQPPQKDANCAARLVSNSAVVLGPRRPSGLAASALQSAPLINSTFPYPFPNPLAATPFTQTLRSNVLSASVPVWQSSAAWSSPFQGVSVLWDSGALGQSLVPQNVFNAFKRYYDAGFAEASQAPGLLRRGWSITPCPNSNTMCGSNIGAQPYSCQQILMQGTPTQSDIAFARRLLKNMYPPSIDMTLQGGAVAQLPTAFPVNICTGTGNNPTATAGVAVCSYVQPASDYYFWVAGPWFTGRFVQFDLSGPAAGANGSVGTISFSQPLNTCTFT